MTQEIAQPPPGTDAGRVDPVRLAQFIDLYRTAVEARPPVDELPARLAHLTRHILPVASATIRVAGGASSFEPAPVHPFRLDVPLATAAAPGHLLLARERAFDPDTIALAHAIAPLCGLAIAQARAADTLHTTAELRRDALAAMAHDVRTPLNGLIGYTQLLDEGAFGDLTAEQREIVAILARQAHEVVDLLNATLDVARLETGRLPLRVEQIDLGRVCDELARSTFAQPTRAACLRWLVPADLPPLASDRVKVKEILQNLIGNALEHRAGGIVEVEVSARPGRDGLRIAVRDHGAGVPDDLLPHLFEAGRSARAGGKGFGLYIVRQFAEALGGRVVAHSTPGAGTTMLVELPHAPNPRGGQESSRNP